MKYTAAHWGSYEIHGEDIKPLSDDPAPSRIGKGWVSASRDRQSRILKPAVRRGWLDGDEGARRCDDKFVEVSWDKAANLVAEEIARVSQSHGNGAIYAGSYGWASAGRLHHAQSQMKRLLNLTGGFVTARNTYSHAAGEVIMPHITGLSQGALQQTSTSWSLLARHCTLLVSFGGLSGRNSQTSSSGTLKHETESWLASMNARKVNVSPRNSDMSDADWLSIRPGTDVALMLALCHTLLVNNWHNEAFLETYTSGWPVLRDYLMGIQDGIVKSAGWAATICDIDAVEITSLAADMAKSETLINVTWSLQRGDHGEQAVWAGLALSTLLGQIGRPGTGFGFGYGCVGNFARPTKRFAWPGVPQGQNAIKDFIPVARIADMLLNPGGEYDYNGEKRIYPDIRLVIWSGGNPYHHHQDLKRLSNAWKRPETVIVCDHSWTATARRGDIILPATTPLERADIMMNKSEPALIYMSPLFATMGEAKDDHDVWRLVASKLGLEDVFTEGRSKEDWLRWLWSEAQKIGAADGLELPSFETFVAEGRFDIPDAEQEQIAFEAFIKDPKANPLATESGKFTLFNETIAKMDLIDCPGLPSWMEPVESLISAPKGALHLISAQPDTRLHSQNDRGSEALSDKIEGRECCQLHPKTAVKRGISEGSIVRIHNNRGATLAGVRFDAALRQDCIALPTGAWFDPAVIDGEWIDLSGNPNAVTLDQGTSGLAQGNIGHTTLVFVEPWTKALPPLSVSHPPEIVSD
ncbi:biotin/methionine sulfoxide reductase [Cohaesibacter sp. ES.047]|uniref:molybdopterin-dependent oxidoreductase n=1 Tax=Cohaesibacter sp. ES.047 TaxID=1798205 RepID=UPI000BBF86AA|nr:molybdopterin-dependent oxidoreductase [Cohaesibacter sp. ES.047]SNY90746.1 biotin/methionine sulfoxide reductase [Cohaesibacter sp. ES.047]